MTDEEIREQKLQICQQYGITQEQIDAFVAAFCKLWEAVKETLEKAAAAFHEIAEQIDAGELAEAIEAIQAAVYKEARPPSYSLANTRQYNARQRQKLKSYKNRIGSAAIRRPKRIARSCC